MGSHQADPPAHAFRTIRPCRSPAVAAHVHAAPDAIILHVWRACLSDKNCVRVGSRGRARPRVCRCVCVCVCVCVRVRGCVCVSVRARLLIWLCARACTACVNERRLCAPRRCARPPIAQRRLAVFIARPARCGRVRVVVFGAIGFRCRARSAAGVTWTCRTANAPWAARYGHTSVIDAAGAIYVIGGDGGHETYYNDVWVSTDGGVRAGLCQGGWSGVLEGVLRGYYGVLMGGEE